MTSRTAFGRALQNNSPRAWFLSAAVLAVSGVVLMVAVSSSFVFLFGPAIAALLNGFYRFSQRRAE